MQMYVGVYMTLLAICGFVFALFGASVGEAVFETASCLGNTGVGVGFIQNGSSPVVLLAGSAAMLFGRDLPTRVRASMDVARHRRGGAQCCAALTSTFEMRG